MSKRRIAIAMAAASLALMAEVPSFAAAGSASFAIHAVVPTICRVDFDNSVQPVVGQTTDLGQITELCNDGDGYQVMLITPPGATGTAILDGTNIPIAANGQTVLVDSNSDAYKQQDLKIQLAAGSAPITAVHFTTTPKGAIY